MASPQAIATVDPPKSYNGESTKPRTPNDFFCKVATATVKSVAIARGDFRVGKRGEWCLNACGDKYVLVHFHGCKDASIDDGVSTMDDPLAAATRA